jgi:phenylacetic acid degradation operon negative regulatory protein
LFRARQASLQPHNLLIERCYNLKDIQRHYVRFIKNWRGQREKLTAASRPTESACFVAKMRLVYDFADFVYLDPFLPSELLPKDWLGYEAWRIFRDCYLFLAEPALSFFERHFDGPPRTAKEQREGRIRALGQTPVDA